MSFVRRQGKRFYARYRDARGVVVEKAIPAETKTEAKDQARELEREARLERLGIKRRAPEPTKFCAYWDKYRTATASRRGQKQVISRMKTHVLPFLGEKLLAHILPSDVNEVLAKMLADGYALETVKHVRMDIRAMFTSASDDFLMRGPNPASKAMKIKVPKRKPRVIPLELVAAIIAAVPDRHRAMFATAVMTGMRKGELAGLPVQNVNLDGRTIVVEFSYAAPTKDSDTRTVPVPEELVPFLKVELGRARSLYLFPNSTGGMLSRHIKLHKILRAAVARAGIVEGYDHKCRRKGCGFIERHADDAARRCPTCSMSLWIKPIPPKWNFKDLRSTWATHAYRATEDIFFVQKAMGHSDTKITERYADPGEAHLRRQSNRVSYGVSPGMPEEKTAMRTGKERGETLEHQAVVGGFILKPPSFQSTAQRAMRDSNPRPLAPEANGPGVSGPIPSRRQADPLGDSSGPVYTHPHALARARTNSRGNSGGGLRLATEGERLLTIKEVAKRLGVSPATVRRLCDSGALKCVRIINSIRIRETALQEYLKSGGGK
jgi:integrase